MATTTPRRSNEAKPPCSSILIPDKLSNSEEQGCLEAPSHGLVLCLWLALGLCLSLDWWLSLVGW